MEQSCGNAHGPAVGLARIFHESLAATTDMAVLPGVLGCRPLRRTVQVRLGTNPLRLPGGTPIFVVSRQQFMKYPSERWECEGRKYIPPHVFSQSGGSRSVVLLNNLPLQEDG
jgi:hypothetical protein